MVLMSGDDFSVTYPVRLIVWDDGNAQRHAREWNRIAAVRIEEMLAVAIFTDEDLAARFCKAIGVPDNKQYIIASNPNELARWLDRVKELGFQAVAYDPSGCEKMERCGTIDAAIKFLR